MQLFRRLVMVATAAAVLLSLLRFVDLDHLLLLGVVPLSPVLVAVGLLILAATYGLRTLVGVTGGLVLAVGLALPGTVLPRTGCTVVTNPASPGFVVFSHNALVGNQAVQEFAAQLVASNPDVVLLQEAPEAFVEALVAELEDGKYPHIETHGLQSILSRWALTDVATTGTRTGGALIATMNAPNSSVRIANFHASAPLSGERRTNQRIEFEAMSKWREAESVDLVMGDFNAGAAQPLYRNAVGDGYVDAHRSAGCGTGLTWRQVDTPALLSLDHALVHESYDVESFEVLDYAGSDHKAIAVRISAGSP